MNSRKVIFGLIFIGVVAKSFVQGLQCYVCEDCNEYEDFKELHICGEISIVSPTVTASSATNKPSPKPSSKPSSQSSIEDYLVEESEEKHDEGESEHKKTTSIKSTTITTQTTSTTPKVLTSKVSTPKPSTLTQESTPGQKTTVEPEPLNTPQETSSQSGTTSSTISSATSTATTTKPELPSDYDDYLEYEDATNVERRRVQSLLKINEPVCYMIRYHVNNTVLTNRGCTTFINANKYLTCQSLYNGAPMESCRICSSNGCNKFLDGDDNEDSHGLPTNAAGAAKNLGAFVIIMGFLINFNFKL